jgi:TM2 domain-containing membrane protein YozV
VFRVHFLGDIQMSSSGEAGYGVSRDAQVSMQYDANKKSGLVAYLLWFFVGMFGGHRFYLGSTGPAIAQLVITLVSIVTAVFIIGFVGLAAVGIWVLIDAFLIPGLIQSYNSNLVAHLSGGSGARITLPR